MGGNKGAHMTPDQIIHAALMYTRKQCEALAALELPRAIDIEMFEGMLDYVADNMPLNEHEWDVFASTARLDFYGINEVAPAKRRQWLYLCDDATAALYRSAGYGPEDRADYYNDMARDERVSS
jgi:hypothetical protein